MPLSDLLTRLVRRWWAVVLGVLASIGLGVAAAALVPPTYGATASLLLLPPGPVATGSSTATPAPFNPFLSLGGLDPAASVLVRALNNGDFHDSVAPAGGTASFSVDPDTQASGPLLVVTVADATPDLTMQLLRKVVAQAPITLDQIQSDTSVESSVRIHVSEIAQVSQPTVDRRSQTRAVLAVVVVGLGATTIGALLLDVLLMRRRARRGTPDGSGATDEPDDEGPGAAPAPAAGSGTGAALERSGPGTSPEPADPYGAPWPPPSMVPDVLARPVGPFPEPAASHAADDDPSTREIPRVTARMWSTAFASEAPRRAHGRSSRGRPATAPTADGTPSASDRRTAQESASDQDVDEHPLAPADAG